MSEPDPVDARPPAPWLTLAEMPRIAGEFGALLATWSHLVKLGKGDGHPVLVLPGFTAGDASTLFLRRFLRELDYDVLPWNLGTNTGNAFLVPLLHKRINQIIKATDAPFSIVGQSLGGVFARELARSFPSHVRSVITLGSPFRTRDGEGTSPMVRKLFERSATVRPEERMRIGLVPDASRPPPVPSTAIYSRGDGVVDWRLCVENTSARSESVEVFGSHTGMSMNPLVFWLLADRLRQDPADWRPVDRGAWRRAWLDLALAPMREFPRLEILHPLRSGA
jgi:pimeloyl-ACP methyl ester carboxylesterase